MRLTRGHKLDASPQDDVPYQDKGSALLPTDFLITLIDSGTRKSTPSIKSLFMIKSDVEQLGGKIASIHRQRFKYLPHVVISEQSTALWEIIHIDKHNATVVLHPSLEIYSTKRSIYTSCYTPKTGLSAFAAGMVNDYRVTEVLFAKLIKSPNHRPTALDYLPNNRRTGIHCNSRLTREI